MVIEVNNWRIKKSNGINKFDLYKTHTVEKKGKNQGNIVEVDEAYGISLERCFSIMSHEETFSSKDRVSLESYLSRYNDITNKLLTKVSELNEKIKQ